MIGIRRSCRIGFETTGRLPAVDDRQRQVHENQVGVLACRDPNAFGAINRREDFVGVLQELHEQILIELHVLHHKDLFSYAYPFRCGCHAGLGARVGRGRLGASLVIPQ